MAEIRAFRALRFDTEKAGEIGELVCPPYDVISEEERRGYLERNENNIIRLELPKGDRPYETAGNVLKAWLETGILKQDEKDGIYIYEEKFTAYGIKRKFKGCIVQVKLEEFSKGIVLPHEETLSKAKKDRFELMKATGCNFSQIYSLYADEKHSIRKRLDALSSAEPKVELSDREGVTHRLWIVSDEAEIAAICGEFADKKLYIADGHHRYETALNYRNYCRENNIGNGGEDFVMMMLVDMEHEGLVVFPTHRILHGLKEFNAEKAEKLCEEYFNTEKRPSYHTMESDLRALYDAGKKAFGFYTGKECYTLLTLKDTDVLSRLLPDTLPPVRELDVTVLHLLILERLFGIDKENMAKQLNLSYTKDFSEAIESVRSGNADCAFILNPTRVSEIRGVAAAGGKMPQKSTYFYPKLITGLVMNKL